MWKMYGTSWVYQRWLKWRVCLKIAHQRMERERWWGRYRWWSIEGEGWQEALDPAINYFANYHVLCYYDKISSGYSVLTTVSFILIIVQRLNKPRALSSFRSDHARHISCDHSEILVSTSHRCLVRIVNIWWQFEKEWFCSTQTVTETPPFDHFDGDWTSKNQESQRIMYR